MRAFVVLSRTFDLSNILTSIGCHCCAVYCDGLCNAWQDEHFRVYNRFPCFNCSIVIPGTRSFANISSGVKTSFFLSVFLEEVHAHTISNTQSKYLYPELFIIKKYPAKFLPLHAHGHLKLYYRENKLFCEHCLIVEGS